MKTIDKNAEKIANLIIEKIETISTNWKKPWFTNVSFGNSYIPQNLNGRVYAGGNAFVLSFLCEKFDYQTPIFLTFKQAQEINVKINKGSESFPVYYTSFVAFHRETNEKISFEEYKKLTAQEQKSYKLIGSTRYYLVFNLDQTNYSEVHPEKWEKIKNRFKAEITEPQSAEMYSNLILDNMLKNQNWICPINLMLSDRAYWSNADKIVLPLKKQFVDGQSFYATLLHEMAHSTGTEERLNRKGFMQRDKKNYGREELVAELTSALTSFYFGISATVRDENVQYLKSWCKTIKEEPSFILTVLTDAIKATKYINNHLDIEVQDSYDMAI